eukprot:CAMPEP_0119110496 /NCGR_PEP_ID=MMETSP1180-20130426/30119_1 /TAXON_ID=3052 ORGANISM="Chlamydomonas cf sp, Strain CCMP681" /NCGR_SAMPLE_ID=MMETSP1180 /ASSEMBLY_ACC=CAM_ASM_000741 /LENGTH=31 /DNA_ID= /DNA_START= /DNA_END= /DNA_ORIENTATION=
MAMKLNATYMFDATSFEGVSGMHKVGYWRMI